jgi:ribosomal-protein-alanine N-acetyltransferase
LITASPDADGRNVFMQQTITTARLDLRVASSSIYSIPFDDAKTLGSALGAGVAEGWPVEHYDDDCLVLCRNLLAKAPDAAPWLLRYLVLRDTNTVIGTMGGGLPDNGTYTIGYSILPPFRRRGLASEGVAALVEAAFATGEITRIVAETYPHLIASIGVLRKNGFQFIGPGEEEGVIRYERTR